MKSLSIKEGAVILDCGCGEGFFSWLVSRVNNCTVHSLDINYELVSQLNEKTRSQNIHPLIGDVAHFPYRRECFDAIILSEVLEHVRNDNEVLKELYASLKVGGILVITVPNNNYPFFWDPPNKIREKLRLGHFKVNGLFGGIWAHHLRLYTYHEIIDVVTKSGLNVEYSLTLTHYCLPFNYALIYLSKRTGDVSPFFSKSIASISTYKSESISNTALSRLANFVLSIWRKVDARNVEPYRLENSSVSILVKAVKK
ncbi:MAG: class I SAM-dependent methyltransferase [Thaumarchaeota archaeon]|nr:class I SAM-dependent methyltransferase [Nitrososphaerota archaeon]MCL5318563.1 class I SAM-dependent methyltransferase [Nitrososphaerota archaeon]